ncbi:nuclear transport factor 2 family protein [Labrys wisconsinensis]|uniref:Ketosteroid isomerase-like protein n=1 Tax=Labrys wisconsinensis TaxID=425677 RepID=A0ABU0J6A0_9HYPH|nr:nuclear transport factor 2 family protein [Labrys wisconsinensis]MDQ0469791.1 ketosteroid isomerase-like protein [Labrys wisconsinensis]
MTELIDPISRETEEIMRRFNDAFLQHDPAALAGLVAEDCVIENTTPAPDGARQVGRAACLAVWQGLAARTDASFTLEEVFVAGERATIRWRYRWGEEAGQSVRGVNLMRTRDGLIVEAMGYVKGA